MINAIFSVIMFAALTYVVGVFAYRYYKHSSDADTTWHKMLAAAKDSATILWSQFCIALAAVVYQLDTFADFIGSPELKAWINTIFGNPKVVTAIGVVIAFITIYARTRPGSKDPVT